MTGRELKLLYTNTCYCKYYYVQYFVKKYFLPE
jgi:hypothetical protein